MHLNFTNSNLFFIKYKWLRIFQKIITGVRFDFKKTLFKNIQFGILFCPLIIGLTNRMGVNPKLMTLISLIPIIYHYV